MTSVSSFVKTVRNIMWNDSGVNGDAFRPRVAIMDPEVKNVSGKTGPMMTVKAPQLRAISY